MIQVGTFGATHGIKGSIKINTSGDALSQLKLPLMIDVPLQSGANKKVKILSLSKNGNHLLAKVEGYDTPEAVVLLRNAPILIPKDLLPKATASEIYVVDLIGLSAVKKLNGEDLGYFIAEVIDNPAHPILRFVTKNNDMEPKEILVPFLNLYVGDWDLSLKQIEVISWELWFEV